MAPLDYPKSSLVNPPFAEEQNRLLREAEPEYSRSVRR